MTGVYKSVQVTRTSRELVRTICDGWCRTEIEEPDLFNTRDFRLQFTEGSSYPEGGSATGWEVEDLCDECVVQLRALLESHGIRISKVETDW